MREIRLHGSEGGEGAIPSRPLCAPMRALCQSGESPDRSKPHAPQLNVTASLRGGVESNRRWNVGPQVYELDSAGCCGEPLAGVRSPELASHAEVAAKAMTGRTRCLEAERREGKAH